VKAGITSHEEHDEFAADWVRVDGAPVESFVFQAHFADLKVPLTGRVLRLPGALRGSEGSTP